MRELYILAVGIAVGASLVGWLEAAERRLSWRAAELAAENIERERRWREAPANPVPDPVATGPATA